MSPVRILRSIFHRIFGTDVYKFHYLTFSTIKCPLLSGKLPFEVKELRLEDFHTGNPVNFTPKKLNLIADRLNSNNYKAFGIVENGTLLYSTWVCLDKITLPNGQTYMLKPDEAILEDSYCEPVARGRHFHSLMNRYRLDYLASSGKKDVIAIVLDGNIPAMKVQLKSGFKEKRVFYSGRIFWKSFSTL